MAGAELTRRAGLGLGALVLAAATTKTALAAAGTPPFITHVDFKNPKWNRDTYARMDGDLDPAKEKLGWLKGTAYGVRPNEVIRPLFGMEGFSFTRILALPGGDLRRMCREVVYYRDLETGKLLDTWHNPYTKETVKVVPIANDPFNYILSEFYPEAPSYGGLAKAEAHPRKPYLLDWSEGPDGTLICRTGIDLMYPAALQPDKWPRESAGQFNRVSEHFIYTIKRRDAENPRLTNLPLVGAWSRITPWQPWMLMGEAQGNLSYFTSFATLNSVDQLPADLVAAVRGMGDKWFHAPDHDYGPSLSSLENYAREQKPAPVPPGWTPPQPPAPRVLPPKTA